MQSANFTRLPAPELAIFARCLTKTIMYRMIQMSSGAKKIFVLLFLPRVMPAFQVLLKAKNRSRKAKSQC